MSLGRGWGAIAAVLFCDAAGAELQFTPMPTDTVAMVMTSGSMPSRHILEVNGGGVALFDFDRDGDLDLFFANGAPFEQPEHGSGSRLFANLGGWRFEDVTERLKIDVRRWAMGVAVGDVDGDGWDDLYLTCFGPNVLLRNVGGTAFEDRSIAAGVDTPGWSTSAAFSDLDGDNDLDLVVVNYLSFDPADPPSSAGKAYRGVPVMPGPRGLPAEADHLYENLGDGRFRDVTAAAGLRSTAAGYGLGVRVFDANGDGRQDLFIGNDSGEDQLYRNLGGMRFEEVGIATGVATNGQGLPQASMGIALGDVDGDPRPDLLVTAFSDDTNTLHLAQPDGFFDDRSAAFGIAASSRPLLGWGAGFFDFDLDGDEDLLVSNGHVYPEMASIEVGEQWGQPALLLERRGTRFEPACRQAWCQAPIHGRAAAFGDLDGDHDVDVVITTLNGPPLLLRNEAPRGRGLLVRLHSPPPNIHGYGSHVELTSPSGTQRRWISGGGSFQSVDAPEAAFGLDPNAAPAIVRVTWPDGTVQVIEGVKPGQTLVITRTTSQPPGASPDPPPSGHGR